MTTIIDPTHAIVLFLLIDSVAWVSMMVYDACQPTQRMRHLSTRRLVASAFITIGSSSLFYLYVEGATRVWIMLIHGLCYGLYPFYMLYGDRFRSSYVLGFYSACLIFTAGMYGELAEGVSYWLSTTLVFYLIAGIALVDVYGHGERLKRWYYRRPMLR